MGRQKSFRIIAVLLAFTIAQASTQLSFAAPAFTTSAVFPSPQLLARLTTKGNLPISVNGISASSGDSVSNGAMIETPVGVDASVDLGPLGSLDIQAETKIKLEYDGDCIPGPQDLQKCSAKVTVYFGCVTAHYKQGSYFKAVTAQEVIIKDSDKSRKDAGTFEICNRKAGAGVPPSGEGLSTAAKVAIAALAIGTGGIIIWAITRDPSPSTG